jgi:hypothetical protein
MRSDIEDAIKSINEDGYGCVEMGVDDDGDVYLAIPKEIERISMSIEDWQQFARKILGIYANQVH